MKRLFCVKDATGKKVKGSDRELKSEAKEIRNSLNSGACPSFYVSRGDQHMGPHGHKINRMRLQPKRVEA